MSKMSLISLLVCLKIYGDCKEKIEANHLSSKSHTSTFPSVLVMKNTPEKETEGCVMNNKVM